MYNFVMEKVNGIEKAVLLTEIAWDFLEEHKEEIAVYSLYTLGIVTGISALVSANSPEHLIILSNITSGLLGGGYLLKRHYENK